VESHRATWARFSSRPKALQTKRRHRHGSFCRSERARHAAAPAQLSLGRGVASCNVGQLFRPPKGSSDPAPATAWRPRRSKRARHAAVPSTGVWIARSRIVRRGPAFQAAQGPFSPSAGSRLAPFAAVSVQDTQEACKARCRDDQRCLASAVSLCETWASFSSRPRALQPKRRQRYGAPYRSKRANTLPRRPQVCGERGVASCDVGQLFKPPKGPLAQVPAAAWRPLPQ
jgi:hypothetical protein